MGVAEAAGVFFLQRECGTQRLPRAARANAKPADRAAIL